MAMVMAKVSGTSSIPSVSSTNHQYTVLSPDIKRTEGTKGRGIRGYLFHYIEQAASTRILHCYVLLFCRRHSGPFF